MAFSGKNCTTDLSGQIANRPAHIGRLTIDVNLQYRIPIISDAHGGPQNFRLLHE